MTQEILLVEIADSLKGIREQLAKQNEILAARQEYIDRLIQEVGKRLPDTPASAVAEAMQQKTIPSHEENSQESR